MVCNPSLLLGICGGTGVGLWDVFDLGWMRDGILVGNRGGQMGETGFVLTSLKVLFPKVVGVSGGFFVVIVRRG